MVDGGNKPFCVIGGECIGNVPTEKTMGEYVSNCLKCIRLENIEWEAGWTVGFDGTRGKDFNLLSGSTAGKLMFKTHVFLGGLYRLWCSYRAVDVGGIDLMLSFHLGGYDLATEEPCVNNKLSGAEVTFLTTGSFSSVKLLADNINFVEGNVVYLYFYAGGGVNVDNFYLYDVWVELISV